MWSWIKSHKVISIAVLVVIIIGSVFWSKSKKATYQEFTLVKTDIREVLDLSGKIDAGTIATLRFGAGGLVTYQGAKEGDQVKKWQTLASVDTRQLQKTLEQKLNLYAIERGEFDQGRDDYDKNIRDGDVDQELRRLLEKNQYQLENTVKDVEYQDLALKLSRLSSPIAGILIKSPLTTANVQVLATDAWIVVDPTSLYFSADLDETDLSRVSVGQKVYVTLDAFPQDEMETTVTSISYAPKETTAGTTYELKLLLPPEKSTLLRLGLNGSAEVILSEKNKVLTLPSSALTTKEGKTAVLVKSGSKYEEREVTTGIENGGSVEIVTGLGDQVHVYKKN